MDPRSRPERDPEAGLTIIEVMVAMLILIVGVLGTFTMIEGSFASTSKTTARVQGTNLARDLLERSRQVAYVDTATDKSPAALRAALPAADAATALSGSSFQVRRRGVDYTVTVFSCAIDDPSDGVGVQTTGGQCTRPDGAMTPGAPATAATAVGVESVLGLAVNVSLNGGLLGTVCNVLGNDSTLLTQVSGLAGGLAPVSVCSSGSAGSVPLDTQPDDLRLVRVTVAWNEGGPQSLRQTTMLTNQG